MDFLAVPDYDVIILKVMMSKLDGFVFVQELRNSGSKIPVLILTSKDTIEDKITVLDFLGMIIWLSLFKFGEFLS